MNLSKHIKSFNPAIELIISIFFLFFIIFSSSCKKVELTDKKLSASQSDDLTIQPGFLQKPNVIVILADDIGYEIPTCDGGQSYQTPNMDYMAATGMRFTQCRASALCSPSRFMLMTGKYNFRNYYDWGVMDPTDKTLGTLFQSQGYKTLSAGKWQFDGGDASIRSLGFDDYCVWNPYEIFSSGSQGSPYKDPTIYQNGDYLPASETAGKYGDDIFTDYINNFIDQNKKRNFFVYYATDIMHPPFCPTPDDPQFAAWNMDDRISDTAFVPSMIKYLDKKIGEIINHLKEVGLYDNTIIMFSGDNGTPHDVFSDFNNEQIEGGKATTTERGIHVPLIVSWPHGIKQPGYVNNNLIDFPDFFRTCAEMLKANVTAYQPLDGVSFYGQLVSAPNFTPRPWSFDHYEPHTNSGNDILKRWAQDSIYKMYDSVGAGRYKFYNIKIDPEETTNLKYDSLSQQEKDIYNNFINVFNMEHN